MKKFIIKTIGCKVNTYESNKIRDELVNLGFFNLSDDENNYDNVEYFIINTCSVTNIADRKSRQMIHRAKKLNPNLKIVATGCYVDSHIDDIDADIDIYVENKKKFDIPKILFDLEKDNTENFNITKKNYVEIGSTVINKNVRSFIKIQDGCNQYCSYCIIPFLRGNITSLSDEEVINEVKNKLLNGTREIVLTGIHLSSFGLDRESLSYENDGAIDIARKCLINIIEKICDLNEGNLERLRLGSLEPRLINEEFICSLEKKNIRDKFCDSFCLSLQSGSDKTLKRMNRHYTTSEYKKVCDLIRKKLPHATITTDVIVGFPGETNEDFEESLQFVKSMRFYNPNIFPYSRRKGTVADKFLDQIDNVEKHRRAKIMIDECEKITNELRNEYIKKFNNDEKEILKNILIEEETIEDGKKYAIGYTKEYMKFKILT